MISRTCRRLWEGLASPLLTLVLLVLLMVVVVMGTLTQVELGTLGAVNRFIRPFFLWAHGGGFSLPVFPGGASVGLFLAANLIAALVQRSWTGWSGAGLWITHVGLLLLVTGEFVTGAFQKETRMVLEKGQVTDYVEDLGEAEVALLERKAPNQESAVGIPQARLAKGGAIRLPGSPLILLVRGYYPNAVIVPRQPADPPSPATMGLGPSLKVIPHPANGLDPERNLPAFLLEAVFQGRSLGTWLVGAALEESQPLVYEGHTCSLLTRPRRLHLPFSLELKQFSREFHPGTTIPRHYSSLVSLVDQQMGETRDVVISMNHPLRYAGKAFYQAGFDKGDTVSILQVVENPGWLIPYVSCALVVLGLLLHFGASLWRLRAKEA